MGRILSNEAVQSIADSMEKTKYLLAAAVLVLAGCIGALQPITATAVAGEVIYEGIIPNGQDNADADDGTVDGVCHEYGDADADIVSCGLLGDDDYSDPIDIGFEFEFYGEPFEEVYANINGALHFGCPSAFYDSGEDGLPSTFDGDCDGESDDDPRTIWAFMDDIITAPKSIDEGEEGSSGYYPTIAYKTVGNPGSKKFIMQWTNMYLYSNPDIPLGTFQIILYEGSNNIQMQYRNLLGDPDRSSGSSATVGIQNNPGEYDQYATLGTPALHPELAILYESDGEGGYEDPDDNAPYDLVYLSIPGAPAIPTLQSPANGATGVYLNQVLKWNAAEDAAAYKVTLAEDSNFADIVLQETDVTATQVRVPEPLEPSTTYYWNVKAYNDIGEEYSANWSFTTGTEEEDVVPEGEDAAPNHGDANNDGTPDSEQANVMSFVSTLNSKYAVLEVADDCTIDAALMKAELANASQDAGFSYPVGLMNFSVTCGEPGYTTAVSQYYYDITPANLVLRKYNPTTRAYFNVPNATLTQLTIGGHTVTKATYSITEGGLLDVDGQTNGVIVDPAGPGQASVGAPNTGLRPSAL